MRDWEEDSELAKFTFKNPSWEKRLYTTKSNVPTLSQITLRIICIGVANRVSYLSASNLALKLSSLEMNQVTNRLLDYNDIRSNKVRDAISVFRNKNTKGIEILLGSTKLKPEELTILEYFCQGTKIDKFNASWNRFGVKGAKEMERILKHDKVSSLDVSWNELGASGAGHICSPLRNSLNLQHLNLSSNQIGPGGCIYIADALQNNKSLQTLNLAFNDVLEEGAVLLSRALKHNSTLQELNLRSNQIGPGGAIALADMLRSHRNIQMLIVADNGIGEEGAEEIAKYFPGSISTLIKCIKGN